MESPDIEIGEDEEHLNLNGNTLINLNVRKNRGWKGVGKLKDEKSNEPQTPPYQEIILHTIADLVF
jgi:hypothetical protein